MEIKDAGILTEKTFFGLFLMFFAIAILTALWVVHAEAADMSDRHGIKQLIEQAQQRMTAEDAIMEAADGYPVEIVHVDHKRKVVTMVIGGWMVEGTDRVCNMAARLFLDIVRLGFKIDVRGAFVPSKHNPIDLAWAQHLAENDNIGRTDD